MDNQKIALKLLKVAKELSAKKGRLFVELTPEEQKKNASAFVKELAKLSKKYGIVVKSVGGVSVYSPQEIQSVTYYSDDLINGDMVPHVKYLS